MLMPTVAPKRYRDCLRDPDNALLFERGRHHVVDDRGYRWAEGSSAIRGVSVHEILAIGSARLCVEGPFTTLCFERARVTARQGLVKASDSSFVHALAGVEAHMSLGARFRAEAAANIYIYGSDVFGDACDDVVIFLCQGARRDGVKVKGCGVRFVDEMASS